MSEARILSPVTPLVKSFAFESTSRKVYLRVVEKNASVEFIVNYNSAKSHAD